MRSLDWTVGESFFTFFDLTKNPMFEVVHCALGIDIELSIAGVPPSRADEGGRRLR